MVDWWCKLLVLAVAHWSMVCVDGAEAMAGLDVDGSGGKVEELSTLKLK